MDDYLGKCIINIYLKVIENYKIKAMEENLKGI